jgi:hypothetical protein
MALVGINFDQENKYESFYIVMRDFEHDKIFNSGDPIKDWYHCTKYFTDNFEQTDELDLKMTNEVVNFIVQYNEYDTITLLYNGESIDVSYHESREGINSIINKNGWLLLIKKNERPSIENIKKELNEKFL